MVLESLVDLYEELSRQGKVDRWGWCQAKVSYGLDIDVNGTLKNVFSFKHLGKDEKKQIAASVSVPMAQKRSVNIAPNYLCDTSSYLFGCDQKGKPQRSKQCFEASKLLHNEILSSCCSDDAKAIMGFFEHWDPDNTQSVLEGIGCNMDIITEILGKGANLVFLPLGKHVSDCTELCKCWDSYYNSREVESGLCLVTGKNMPIAKLHPSIKGVRGAQSTGASLVSFNSSSLESYDKSQGGNSPVSEYAAFAYVTALNFLLTESEYVNTFGDTTVVGWAEDANECYQDIMAKLTGGKDDVDQDTLHSVIGKIANGEMVNWDNIPIDPSNRFFVLGLSPNASRLSVRFFLQSTFGVFMQNAKRHDDDMKIILPKFIKNHHFPAWKILRETVNPMSKDKSAKPQLAGDFIYSILTGCRYPDSLYNNIMIRQKANPDVSADHEAIRCAITKAYLLRNYPQYKEALTMDQKEVSTNKARVMGELFSVLEKIQMTANPDIKATIKDRFFSSASSTPGLVFPRLVDLSIYHLKKIKSEKPQDGCKLEEDVQELMERIGDCYPDRLSLQEKGIFQVGYYYRKQLLYTKKEDKANVSSN